MAYFHPATAEQRRGTRGRKRWGMADYPSLRATSESRVERVTLPRLRVLLVNQYYPPADAPTANLLADVGVALVQEGHNVSVICSHRGYRNVAERYPKHDTIDGVEVRRVLGSGFTQRRRRGRVANYLTFFASSSLNLLTIRKPDVIVCLSTPPMLGAIVQTIARIRRVRMVYWVMDVHPELAFRLGQIPARSLIGKALETASKVPLRHADVIIALGDDMAAKLEPHSNGNTRVVRNWADGDRIVPCDTENHPLRKQWGWEGKFVVAYSGNMGLVHEFETILEAATALNSDDRYLFCFIGGGPRRDDFRAEVTKRKLGNVEFRDYVPENQLSQSLTAANVHLISLRDDLAGLSVPSKMHSILAAGRPIAFIGPLESDIAVIVSENECGVHIRNGDAKGLVSAIRAYGESPRLESIHAMAAREAFDANYSAHHGLRSMVRMVTEFT